MIDSYYSRGSQGRILKWFAFPSPVDQVLSELSTSMKRQKDMTLKDELPSSVGAQYATGEEWRNSSRKNEEAEPK